MISLGVYAHSSQYQSNYTEAIDLWSLGCTIYYMLTGKNPFTTNVSKPDGTQEETVVGYAEGKFNPLPDGFSTDITDLLSKLFQLDSPSRANAFGAAGDRQKPLVEYVLDHSWFKQCRSQMMNSVSEPIAGWSSIYSSNSLIPEQ